MTGKTEYAEARDKLEDLQDTAFESIDEAARHYTDWLLTYEDAILGSMLLADALEREDLIVYGKICQSCGIRPRKLKEGFGCDCD